MRRPPTGREGPADVDGNSTLENLTPDILAHSPVRVLLRADALASLGRLAAAEGASRALVVTDPAIREVGYLARALEYLREAGVECVLFDQAQPNPTTETVAAGLALVREAEARGGGAIDFVVGLGGGSAMDCAKGINLLYSGGGTIGDYQGINKATRPLLPSILVPTTAGTGSEAQSFALISDSRTHMKMACGDRRLPTAGGLRPRWAILDPQLARTQPAAVAAATGMDAITHAIETAGSTAAGPVSRNFSLAAWTRLERHFPAVLANPADAPACSGMLLGAHLAGCAIESSMLGAAHACANPLTARFDVVHGIAVGLMLPHVLAFNSAGGSDPYESLGLPAAALIERVRGLLAAARLPQTLSELGIPKAALRELAELAAAQWTATFNPRPVGPAELLRLYEAAYA